MRDQAGKKKPNYLDGVLHEHTYQAVDIFFPRGFEVRIDLVNQRFHAENQEWECRLQNLVHFLNMIPGTA